MTWLISLIVAILRMLLPAVLAKAAPTAEDGRRDVQLRTRLRDRVRATWGTTALLVAFLMVSVGCTRTIYVAYGEPVRLRETIPNAKVWVMDADGKPVAGRMPLHEGWYCLPDPGAEARTPAECPAGTD